MAKRKPYLCFIASAFCVVLLACTDLCCGPLGLRELVEEGLAREILLSVRLPRVLTAMLAGSCLALSGVQMQAVFRNPLADPHIMGISAGAGTGAAAATVLASSALAAGGRTFIAASAFIGAMVPSVVMATVSHRVRNGGTLLLFGVMMGFIFSAATSLIAYGADSESLKMYYSWTAGSFSGRSAPDLWIMGAALAAGLAIALGTGKGLDALMFGDSYATLAGVPLKKTRTTAILSCCLMTGAVTAFCGPVGFIGMTAPHVARGIFRTTVHRSVIPASLLTGAAMALIADILGQIWSRPLPAGSTAALIAIPLVLVMLIRGRNGITA